MQPIETDLPPKLVVRLLRGRMSAFGPNGEPSAIDKHCVTEPLQLRATGFAGDEQGDPLHHGGTEKALHHYPQEHYAAWRRDLPHVSAARFAVGGFGENLSAVGLTEANVCLGDIFRLGTALIQVSQVRQPCWKLGVRFGVADMALRVQETLRAGWYYRVLEGGEVAPDAELRLIERPHPAWSVARLLHHLYIDPLDRDALETLAALPVLAPACRKLMAQRLASGQVEDWSRRLNLPGAS